MKQLSIDYIMPQHMSVMLIMDQVTGLVYQLYRHEMGDGSYSLVLAPYEAGK